jgi:hypothetical protein
VPVLAVEEVRVDIPEEDRVNIAGEVEVDFCRQNILVNAPINCTLVDGNFVMSNQTPKLGVLYHIFLLCE